MNDYLITTVAKIKACRCGDLILAGISEGLTARVDLTPVDEPEAIRADRSTYTLRGGRLNYRDDFARAAGPPPNTPVLATHVCWKGTLL